MPRSPVKAGMTSRPPAARAAPRLLFLHQNFPGQYKHVAKAMAAAGADVLALTDAANKQADIVRTVRYTHDARSAGTPHPLGVNYVERLARGESVARAAGELRRTGFDPDLIIGHFGWGETLLIKAIWPKARLLLYAEFYYRAAGADVNFDPEFRDDEIQARVRTVVRNTALLAAMAEADRAQAPTRWQRDQFPDFLRSRIEVVHDGIDTQRLKPDPDATIRLGRDGGLVLRPGDEVVTFVNRNLEPCRGYHAFMRALPKILRERPNARAVIVGGDGVSYGRPSPDGRTWKEIFLDEVKDALDLSRVHFVGRVAYDVFVSLMQVSSVHVYLTYPFVLSWSLMEAMSAGCLIVGSDTPPVAEVVTHGKNGLLVDFFDIDALADQTIAALADPRAYAGLRAQARRAILERYDLQTICLPRQKRLIESLLPG